MSQLRWPLLTRQVDERGRLYLRVEGRPVGDLLGWDGPLRTHVLGPWTLVGPETRSPAAASLDRSARPKWTDGYISLPVGLRHRFHTFGGQAVVAVLPGLRAVGLFPLGAVMDLVPLPAEVLGAHLLPGEAGDR